MDFFRALETHHVFAIVDACFSGALAKNIEKPSYNQRVDLKPSRWLLSSGALEKVSDGSGKHSPFANSLFSALIDTDHPEINVLALCHEVLATIDSNTKDQTPIGQPLFGVGHMMGQFVFYRKGYSPKPVSLEESSPPTSASKGANPTRSSLDETVNIKSAFVITTFDDLKVHLKNLIIEDLEFALHSYNKVIPHESFANATKNEIALQLGSFNSANNEYINGRSTQEQKNRTFARIRYALTQMIDKLDEKYVVEDFATILMT